MKEKLVKGILGVWNKVNPDYKNLWSFNIHDFHFYLKEIFSGTEKMVAVVIVQFTSLFVVSLLVVFLIPLVAGNENIIPEVRFLIAGLVVTLPLWSLVYMERITRLLRLSVSVLLVVRILILLIIMPIVIFVVRMRSYDITTNIIIGGCLILVWLLWIICVIVKLKKKSYWCETP